MSGMEDSALAEVLARLAMVLPLVRVPVADLEEARHLARVREAAAQVMVQMHLPLHHLAALQTSEVLARKRSQHQLSSERVQAH